MPGPFPVPRSDAGLAGLAAVAAAPAHALVACDYDGTLAPIVADPTRAWPQEGAVDALTALASRVGSIALITGRPASVAVALGGLEQVPGLVVLGAYGAQRWEAGATTGTASVGPGDVDPQVRTAVDRVVAEVGPAEARVETKGSALAVHVRGSLDSRAALVALLGPLTQVAEAYGLAVEPGRQVIELRPAGTDKGHALRALVAERGARSVVFVGDDLGDLAAFAAVDAWRESGGHGLTVASRSDEAPAVAAAADLVVEGPPGVVEFLRQLADQIDQIDQIDPDGLDGGR